MFKVVLPLLKNPLFPAGKFHAAPEILSLDMTQWLVDNVGPTTTSWYFYSHSNTYKWFTRIENNPMGYYFYFKENDDAVLFKLTWA